MKKRALALALSLLLLVLVTGTAVAGGASHGTFIRFLFYDGDVEYYCEGYFLETGSGIVHEWRNNPECINYGSTSLHLVFKPTSKFDDEGCDDEDCFGCYPGPWTLTDSYVDLPDDEADLTDYLDGEFWTCVYYWDSD